MKIKCTRWEFDGASDFCCEEFKQYAFSDLFTPDITISHSGTIASFKGVAIKSCPFCGKKIELERGMC